MATTTPKPGRARVSLKIRTSTMSIDSSGGYMPEAAALVIYRTAITGDFPWRAELDGYVANPTAGTLKALGDRVAKECEPVA